MDTLTIGTLGSVERFLIWAIRIGLAPQFTSSQTHHILSPAFDRANVSHALNSFLEFIGIVAHGWHYSSYSPDVRCTCSTEVSADEQQLVQILAALQSRELNFAWQWIQRVAPMATQLTFIDRALHVALALRQQGLVLTLQNTAPKISIRHLHSQHGMRLH